jgi:hypothetical protein
MNFMNAMKEENDNRKSFTENGAVAYETSGKEILDFNFKLSGYRKASIEDIQRDFERVYFEDPIRALRFLFWVGDIREGVGERKVFRAGITWLANNRKDEMKALIPFISEYNRFDSLLPLLDTELKHDVVVYYKEQLKKDIQDMKNGNPISLLAKWLPSENASSAETIRYAKILIKEFNWNSAVYRKTLSTLRKYLDVVEVKMSAKNWNEIDYNKVPSKANLIYNEAFLRNDENRRREFLDNLKKGEAKINAGVLQPHEIVTKYEVTRWGRGVYDETLEQLWKNLPDISITNTLVVRDGSGSMISKISGNTTCLDVATALTIYAAEHNSEGWKNKFVTFSSQPKVVDISKCNNLFEKLRYIYGYDECSNTDIYATMKLILNTAVKNKISQEDMPGCILILSDMQFDGRYFNFSKTLFENIIDEFEASGYKMPKLCFWNINDRGENTIPLKQNDFGLILCSGFSVQIMKMMMSGELDPYKVLLETINSPRYDPIEEVLR